METDVRKILQTLADTAANAADEARTAAQGARRAMEEKYDLVRLGLEHSRLKTQQERVFADIGRTMFLLRCGAIAPQTAAPGEKTPEQMIDSLLLNAEQVQQEMDAVAEKMSAATQGRVCPHCAAACEEKAAFCAACGTRLDN